MRQKRTRRTARGLLLAVLFSGCSMMSPTQYGPMSEDWKGGYEDSKVQKGTYNVAFYGNGFTSQTTAKNYLLYRCAEITLRDGYDYFVIVEGNSVTNYSVVGQGAGASTVSKPEYTATIRLGKGRVPANNPNAYDAREVKDNLGPSIQRKTKD